VVEQAMAASGDEATHEAGIAAAGMVEAVRLLRGRYTLVVTNPPWLRRGKHLDVLKNHADKYAPDAKQELATIFLSRALRWCGSTGSVSMVLPHNWLFLGRYRKLRETLLSASSWTGVARLGEHAFESPEAAGAFAALVALTTSNPTPAACFFGIDASNQRGEIPILASEKAEMLRRGAMRFVVQAEQLMNPDARIMFVRRSATRTLADLAESSHGIGTFDSPRFCRSFWEQYPELRWTFQQSTPDAVSEYGGCSYTLLWESGAGELAALMAGKALDGYTSGKWRAGLHAWGKRGVIVGQMNDLPCSLFVGEAFDENASAIVPLDPQHIPAMWAYCSSARYRKDVRCIDQKVNVTNATLVKVPFDLAHWQGIAAETYPEGLPEPQSNDPKQWLFHAHPAAMLAAGPASASPFAIADKIGADRHPSLICRTPNEVDVLQVAVARLVGYRWPAELDPAMELDPAARDWVTRCDHLLKHADDDGIVPINAMRGEPQAEERLVALLRDAFTEAGADFSQSVVTRLIVATGSKAGTLTEWLLNDFFEQHCKLSHHRPFVWHLWDGRKDGFNVLVLYHRLAAQGQGGRQILEKVTYSYLKDWIDRQEAGVKEGTAGAEARLAAAITLQKELKQILEGEAPYDIFVRWKPLAQQPVGWAPDINDGVRLNIRPFLLARDVGKKGAGILKAKPNIKWTKDRGSEPQSLRPQAEYPWFWGCDPEKNLAHQTDFLGGRAFTGERWNDLHYTLAAKAAVGKDR
jgi:hypothetical protein